MKNVEGNVHAERAQLPKKWTKLSFQCSTKSTICPRITPEFVNEIMDCFYWTGDMVQGILLKFGDPVSGLKGPSSLVNMLILACCQFC